MKSQRSKHKNVQSISAELYTRLAMSTFKRCDVFIAQHRAVSLLVSNIIRNPAVTVEDRANERTALLLLLETVENYQFDAEAWRELVGAVVDDARHLPDVRLSADEALRLMDDAHAPARRSYLRQSQSA